MTVFFDTELHAMPLRGLQEQTAILEHVDASSPRWVSCKKCGAYRGDPCHTGKGYCEQRIELNRARLGDLDTWAIAWRTPCHEQPIWLVWRSTQDKIVWQGVPCFVHGCGKTYTVERHVSDHNDERVPVDRINPNLVEMNCWAAEDSNPWKS